MTEPTPYLARKVTVDEDAHTLTVDGFTFPWYISEGIDVTGLGSAHEPVKRVSFTLLADTVEVIPARQEATE